MASRALSLDRDLADFGIDTVIMKFLLDSRLDRHRTLDNTEISPHRCGYRAELFEHAFCFATELGVVVRDLLVGFSVSRRFGGFKSQTTFSSSPVRRDNVCDRGISS